MAGSTLPSINAYVDASKKVSHGDETTEGTICHNCYGMEIIRGNSIIKPKRYWCESLHREINPHDVRCPLIKKVKKKSPKFNNREVGKKRKGK